MKKFLLLIPLALAVAVVVFFATPIPIVSHPDTSKIEWIMVNPNFGDPDSIPVDVSVSDDVAQDILAYLHQSTMRRNLTNDSRHFSLSRVAIYLSIVNAKNETLFCTFGAADISACSRGYGSPWYSITSPSPETILSDLCNILSQP